MIDPRDDEIGWSKILTGDVWSPGVVTLSGHTRKVGWDVKDASGQDGGTTTRKGGEVPRFSAEFYLVDDPINGSDFEAWDEYQALLESTIRGDEPKAIPLVHPDLARNYITAACLESMGEMKLDGLGGARITVGFIEYHPPKPKPAASPSKATDDGADSRIDEALAELESVKAEGENL